MNAQRLILAVVVLTLLGAAASAGATERSQVPDLYKWRLTDLYASEAAWLEARDGIAARLPGLAAYQGRLGESGAVLFAALDAREAADSALARLNSYATMLRDQDLRESRPSELARMADHLAVDFYAAVAYMRPELLALGADRIHDLVAQEPRLVPYRPWLDDVLRYAPHTGTASEERLISQAGRMTTTPTDFYGVLKYADMPYPEIVLSTGEKVRLDDAAYVRCRAAANRDDRRRVFRAFWGAHQDFARSLGTALDAEVRTHLFEKDAHHYASCLEAALFPSALPPAVYTQLIADVHANLPTLHRYLRLRRRMMGLDTLGYEDLYAPIVKQVDLHYTPEQAQELVLAAVAPLGADYVATLKRGYASRWVDWMPTTGKQSGAYSGGVYGAHPYQLLNFNGLYDDVSTLAHESGHSMHSWLSATHQPYVTSGYKTFIAEVASTLDENLLLHYVLDHTRDRDTRLFLLGSRLDDLRTTMFRQVLFAEFELGINEMAERGEPLTGDKLNEFYLKLLREYYGHDQGICRVDGLYSVEWSLIDQFYRNFYVFQYATSIIGSSSIAAQMRAEAALRKPVTRQRDAALRLFEAGDSKEPIVLLQEAGVDMTTSAPFDAAMKEMNGIMDEMERLLARKP